MQAHDYFWTSRWNYTARSAELNVSKWIRELNLQNSKIVKIGMETFGRKILFLIKKPRSQKKTLYLSTKDSKSFTRR